MKSRQHDLARLARHHGLVMVAPAALVITRERRGRGFCFRAADGTLICDFEETRRLRSLAVPPAYANVRYAADPHAHLQAVGTDAAGRLQYRYHPDWTLVREVVKARRLAGLAAALPAIRRAIKKKLAAPGPHGEPDAGFAAAAVAELVAATAIRAGNESYAREHGTRGATTLLKANLKIEGPRIRLKFRAKGGKAMEKEAVAPSLATALARLAALPGRRLFQYRGADGNVHPVRSADVNAFLRAAAGTPVSLKDFRALFACVGALETLGRTPPATSIRGRKAQIRTVVTQMAEQLGNTPAVCQKSYIHAAVLTAFDSGQLARFARHPGGRTRSRYRKVDILARILTRRPPQKETVIAAGAAMTVLGTNLP